MRRLIVLALTMCLLVCAMPDAHAELQRSPVLDAALTMLEEDNLFLRRYNEITGASVEPYFKLGVPYFFGGVREQWLFAKYPDYMTRECWENTTYYVKGQVYIMGWDCAGFTQWVWDKSGRGKHASISKIIGRESHSRHCVTKRCLSLTGTSCTICCSPAICWGERAAAATISCSTSVRSVISASRRRRCRSLSGISTIRWSFIAA